MTFSSKVKDELCHHENKGELEKKYQIYGAVSCARFCSKDKINLVTENRLLCDILSNDIASTFLMQVNVLEVKKVLSISIKDKNDIENLFEKIEKAKLLMLSNKKGVPYFLRGAFLACGVISNPNSSYYLEFHVQRKKLALYLINLILSIDGLNFKPKLIERKDIFVIYLKECESIIDFLTYIGAANCAMEMMQIKMVKEVRNYVNRTTNFEAANLSKTAKAAAIQIEAINNIKRHKKLRSLPKDLYELAILRLENPQMSLKELSSLLSIPISRSGVNHRISKIIKISEELGQF